MKMRTMSQISILNYLNIVKPNLSEREQWVLEAVEQLFPCDTEMVASHLGVGVHIVSGRMTGLKKKGSIIKAYRGSNSQGRAVDFWQPSTVERENDSY